VTVTDAGAITEPLTISSTGEGFRIAVSFGVFFPGKLAANFYDGNHAEVGVVFLQTVNPSELISLDRDIKIPSLTKRVSLRLIDAQGIDRGSLGEAQLKRSSGGA
jgi:hypothetical protein